MRSFLVTVLLVAMAGAMLVAQRATAPARGRTSRATTVAECAADLGSGVKSKRAFCDVLIASTPSGSVSMTIPAHVGTSTLQFDLHNRFTIPALAVPGPLAYARHEAIIAVIRSTGDIIGRYAVVKEYRAVTDLFDQIGGGTRPGGVKAIAPGPPEPIRVVIPAGVTAIGIVGSKLKVTRRATDETFEAPGAPVAIVSNLRIEFGAGR
jgi:hypothetical protein